MSSHSPAPVAAAIIGGVLVSLGVIKAIQLWRHRRKTVSVVIVEPED